jgi:hypothetical protein
MRYYLVASTEQTNPLLFRKISPTIAGTGHKEQVSMPRPRNTQPIQAISVVITPRVLTIPAAARYLSATTWYVEELLRNGNVPSFIQGKARVVDRLELDKYVDRRNAEPASKLTNRVLNFEQAA